MEPHLIPAIWTIFLQAQGLVGLLLLLVGATLYTHRRRSYFLYWMLAWGCFSLWHVLGGVLAIDVEERYAWLPYAAAVCGWWHVSLWMFGLLHLRHVYQTELSWSSWQAIATPPSLSGPPLSQGPPLPHYLSVRAVLGLLAVTAVLAVVLQVLRPGRSRGVLLDPTMAVVYAGSAVWFARRWWRTDQFGVLLLPVSLGLCALARLYSAALPILNRVPGRSFQDYSFQIDPLLQAFTVVAMIVVLLSDEDALLRDTVRRLAESEDRFRLLFEHGGVGMALLSPEGDFVQVNPALAQMLGYSAEELHGRHVSDVTHAEDRTSNYRRGESPRPANGTTGQPEREKRFLRQDGGILWARVMRVPVCDGQGEVRYHACVFIDVTGRREAEQALAASEQRLRLRFHEAFDGICLWSAAGTFLDANPALCRLLGQGRESLLGHNVTEVAVEPEAVRRHLRVVLERSADRCETRLYCEGGSLVDVEVNSAVLEVEGQRLIQGICRDISARKRAEAALRRAEETLREERDFITQVLQTAEALIIVTDPDGRILRFNAKCEAVSGYREDEVRGRPFWNCLLPERVVGPVQEAFRQLLQRTETGATLAFENPWRTRDGDERLISWRDSVVRDARGNVRHVIGIGLDITDQRRLEEQVARARKMETLGTLVGGIAHDFNNQLTAILGNLGLVLADLRNVRSAACGVRNENHTGHAALIEKGPGSPQSAIDDLLPCVVDAERAAQRCAQMTGRLLTFSRGRLGERQPLQLEQVVGETVRALQHQLPPTLRVEVTAAPGLWPVDADVAQVQELLLELARNARDAMPQGGSLTLSLANRVFQASDCAADLDARPGSFVELTVTDTGCGMPPEVRERLFEPFFTTKKVGQGVGLGLAVVFGIIKGHKGWISCASTPGEGTTFRVYLPATETPAAPRPAAPEPAAVSARAHGHILVVDDEPLVRDLARIVLERANFRVLIATGGEEALDIYRRRAAEIDLVLLDYTMPRMTGLQVLDELRKLDPDVCVVFSSGYAMEQEVDHLLATGAEGFVPKPYRPQDLIETIRQALARKKTPLGTEQQG